MVGGGITGAMIMGFHVLSQAPHGGIFVFFAMNNTWPMFLVSTLVGTIAAAVVVIILKKFVRKAAPLGPSVAEPAKIAV